MFYRLGYRSTGSKKLPSESKLKENSNFYTQRRRRKDATFNDSSPATEETLQVCRLQIKALSERKRGGGNPTAAPLEQNASDGLSLQPVPLRVPDEPGKALPRSPEALGHPVPGGRPARPGTSWLWGRRGRVGCPTPQGCEGRVKGLGGAERPPPHATHTHGSGRGALATAATRQPSARSRLRAGGRLRGAGSLRRPRRRAERRSAAPQRLGSKHKQRTISQPAR